MTVFIIILGVIYLVGILTYSYFKVETLERENYEIKNELDFYKDFYNVEYSKRFEEMKI